MKIFIVADLEGAVGVSKRSQCYFMKPDFQYGRRCLTDDVNAVVKGAIEAGADGIVVRDTHETGRNIIWRGFHLRCHTFRVGHPDSFQLRRHTRDP